nr:Wzz/FepE/Etk N-terminal domain-containing protein [Acidimicrobiia bacterium]
MDRAPTFEEQLEPTVAGAAWQYRWLVLFLAIGFAGLGYLYATRTDSWTSTASIAVEDPRVSNLFTVGYNATPERYVGSQAEIISSRAVAARAVEIAASADPPVDVTVDYIVEEGLSVSSAGDSDLITLTYVDYSEHRAITVVNAIAAAYQEVGREAAIAEFDTAILELETSIASLTSELLGVQEELRRLRASDANRLALEDQLESAISRLLLFEPSRPPVEAIPPADAVDPLVPAPVEDPIVAAIAENTARLNEIRLEIETIQAALARTDDDVELQALEDLQSDIRQRLLGLQLVRDQREVDAQLSLSGVVFYDPADKAEAGSVGLLVVGGFLFGAIVGSAIALPLSRGRRRFGSRSEPERLLGIPLVADVPSFMEERLATNLPVVEAPASASAESYRFVSAAISLQRDRVFAEEATAFTSVMFTSPQVSAGKTTSVANTAFAAALGGNRVLVIDADFSSQDLTTMLIGSVAPRLGLADVIEGTASLGDAVVSVN